MALTILTGRRTGSGSYSAPRTTRPARSRCTSPRWHGVASYPRRASEKGRFLLLLVLAGWDPNDDRNAPGLRRRWQGGCLHRPLRLTGAHHGRPDARDLHGRLGELTPLGYASVGRITDWQTRGGAV